MDNIHGIFAAAASQFSLEQFAAFNQLITENWMSEREDMKHKLLALLGVIGKDTKSNDLGQKVQFHFPLTVSLLGLTLNRCAID